jgi:hypothetical protein
MFTIVTRRYLLDGSWLGLQRLKIAFCAISRHRSGDSFAARESSETQALQKLKISCCGPWPRGFSGRRELLANGRGTRESQSQPPHPLKTAKDAAPPLGD